MAIGYKNFVVGKVNDGAGGQRWSVMYEIIKQQGRPLTAPRGTPALIGLGEDMAES